MSFRAYFPVTDEEAARICADGQQETGQAAAATCDAQPSAPVGRTA